ncbi:MAG TPA: ATP-dependent DNA helicase [Actinomycetota bacterium]|nr:ATP-dependent DNA helicase [Actinomycetota bacterium]
MQNADEATPLDEPQRLVLEHPAGPLVALGGPGTGKTTVLERRFLRLASGASPDRILFLVPNRAQKMALQERLTRRLLSGDRRALIEVPVYTWHGLAHHLVTRNYDRLAYPEPPVLLTSPEQWGAVREALASEEPANWPHHGHLLKNPGFVDEVVDFCIRAEQRLLDDGQLDALAAARPAWGDVVRFFKGHRRNLRSRSRVDYPSLLADAAELVAQHDDVRAALQTRFLHILVDDGQELALVQQRLLHFLAGFDEPGNEHRSLVVAGDPDSSIETFRGAEPDWIDDFAKEFGAHGTVTLTTSYRLGDALGRSALGMIERNGPGPHRAADFAGSSSLEVRRFTSLAGEVEAIARELRLVHLQERVPYEDMAILLTSPRSMLPPLERALDALEVPFSIRAPDRPLAREPIIRAFDELAKFAFKTEPDPEGIVELLRSPLIGLDDATVREIERVARLRGRPVGEVLGDLGDEVGAEAREQVAELLELRALLAAKRDAPADEAFWVVWERSRLCRELQARARRGLDDPANRDLDALLAFSRALGRFVERRHGTGTYVDYQDAMGRADFGSDPWLPPERSAGGVDVLSFHGAKGREWSVVAVAGVVEGSIPKGRRASGLFDPYYLDETNPVARSKKNDMEDRRVFYVALTRATQRCIVTTSPGPSRRGEPSRFIEELTGAVPEVDAPADLPPLTFAEAAARYRKVLADTTVPAPDRIAALAAIARTCELDPSCSPAQPNEWWWRWDWTDGALSIREQQRSGDEDLAPDKLRTSYSRISTYDNCGLQYLCSVVLGLDPDSSYNMQFGSVVHKVFEEIETGTLPLEWNAVAGRYDALFAGIAHQFPNRATARQFHREGLLMIERYGRYLKPGAAAVAEATFRVDLDGHRITGRIDRVDKIGKNIVISDYKTSKSVASWEEARASLQLAIYYLAATTPGAVVEPPGTDLTELGEPAAMQLVYPNVPPVNGNVQKRSQKPEEAQEVLARLPVLIDGVLAEDFRPNPEADCKWCKFKPLCPLWSEGKELPA